MSALFQTYARAPLEFVRGEGVYLTTADGQKFLDFGAGIAVCSLGHAHPRLVEALNDQAEKLWHVSNLYRIPGQERLGARLVESSFADRVFFTNSGAEALECAIKTARKFHAHQGNPEKYRLITFSGAFHGRTLATIAAGGQEKYLEGFGPAVQGFDQVPYGDIEAVKAAIVDETAGILIEPIQGEGGIRTIPWSFFRQLREIADKHSILLIFDEVQSGSGRTGKLFAYEWTGIEPDIIAIAKGIGSGFPLGACLATQAASEGMNAGTHGTTFGGNPLAMAVGNTVLDIVTEPGFLERVSELGLLLKQKLAQIVDDNSDIFELVRGEGLWLGLKCKVPNQDVVASIIDQNLLVVGAGENVIRIMPPLIVDQEQIDDACKRIESACHAYRERR
ncbi:MAG: aspartate aminotransferase family protein [Methyloligellaceae bacterium]